jgi:DNA-binding CsgD family transcriptional regulator
MALSVDDTQAASRAMQGEFLATKALALSVTGLSPEECRLLTRRATEITTCVEARAYAACAAAVAIERSGGSADEVISHLQEAEMLGVWDAIVATVRAVPALLSLLAEAGAVDSFLTQALRSSADHDLARRAGLDLGRRARVGSQRALLSPREREVLELVKQGLTNREIARALFLSEATVKVHVRHILDKTGTRTRTEAATSTDFDV